jgi:TPR repeat protein
MYVNGQGVRQDFKKAKELFGKACDGGMQAGCDQYKVLNMKGY